MFPSCARNESAVLGGFFSFPQIVRVEEDVHFAQLWAPLIWGKRRRCLARALSEKKCKRAFREVRYVALKIKKGNKTRAMVMLFLSAAKPRPWNCQSYSFLLLG